MRPLVKFLLISSLLLPAPIETYASTIQTVTLDVPTVIGGINVDVGVVGIFQPEGVLQQGTTASPTELNGLGLPAGTALLFSAPNTIQTATLPGGNVSTILDLPFSPASDLQFSYSQFFQNVQGRLSAPQNASTFPTAGLNQDVFTNTVEAHCTRSLSDDNSPWYCRYATTLANPVTQQFGTETVNLTAGAVIYWSQWGVETLKFAQPTEIFGLPVAVGTTVRVNKWTRDGKDVIVSFNLSEDSAYQGIELSASQPLNFYDAGPSGIPPLSSAASTEDVTLNAGGQDITFAALKTIHFYRDGSVHYGTIASEQVIDGILFPNQAFTFFRSEPGFSIYSAKIPPHSSVIIQDTTYRTDSTHLFLDFDEGGRVVRVRQ